MRQTAWPFLGSRRMAQMLGGDGHAVNRERAQHSGARTEATHGQAAAGSQGIPVSVALPDHRSGEPGVGGNITHISIGAASSASWQSLSSGCVAPHGSPPMPLCVGNAIAVRRCSRPFSTASPRTDMS